MQKGKVKFFNNLKGFGFVIVDGTGEEIFVHSTAVKGHIKENDNVQFEIVKGNKGLQASNVEVI